MRFALSALALMAIAMPGLTAAQAQTLTGGLSDADRGFYGTVAAQNAARASAGETVRWSSGGRSGTVKFEADADNCKTFFLTETGRAPATGRVCPARGTITGGSPIYVASNVRPAAAAGPRAESRPRSEPPAAPPPPPMSPPPPPPPPPVVVDQPRSLPTPGSSGASRSLPRPGTGTVARDSVPRSLPKSATTAPPVTSAPPPVAMPQPMPAPSKTMSAQKQVTSSQKQAQAPDLEVRGRIVPLRRLEERLNRAGGHAVVLMTHPASFTQTQQVRHQNRNRLLCEALLRNFRESTYARTEVGYEKEKSGQIVSIRPIFWPLQREPATTGSRCFQLMGAYDTDRAAAILDKMEYRDVGPYLVVFKGDQTAAAAINMTQLTDTQIDKMVVYFAERVGQKEDVWVPQVMTDTEKRNGLIAVFGNLFAENLTASVRLFNSGQVNPLKVLGGCFNDAQDKTVCR